MNADSEVISDIEYEDLNLRSKYNEDRFEEKSGSLSGDEMNINDNLKLEKEKIKRRRSSRGVYLSERKIDCSLHIQDSKEQGIVPKSRDEADNMDIDVPKTVSLSKETEAEINTDKGLYSKIKMFEEKTNQLKEESSTWKNLFKTRKHNLANATREYKDAKEGYTHIEENDITAQHKKEMRIITHSQPDYSQYLKNVNIAYDKVLLTEAEMRTASTICKSIIDQSDIVSRNSYKILAKRAFGERRDPRRLLKEFQAV